MNHRVLPLLAAAALLLGGSALAVAQTSSAEPREIKPPYGLTWGETSDRLERLLLGAKAKIVAKRDLGKDREAWDVEGLLQTGLKRSVFYFQKGELVQVELQYQNDDWTQTKYDDFMGKVRRSIEQRYGAGQQIIRKTEPEGHVMQTIVGYKWNVNNTALELYYYAAENDQNVFRTLSVHYKVN
ncbi:MAG: hypothetical protein ACO1QR_14490 [Chthoniobacteraceae bacterium]